MPDRWRREQAAPVGIVAARRALNAAVPEADFMAQVIDLAQLTGWLCHHELDSRRGTAGLPDLTLVRAPRVIFAEMKTEKGRVRPAQQEWLDELGRCDRLDAFVWRPSDFGLIEATLRRSA